MKNHFKFCKWLFLLVTLLTYKVAVQAANTEYLTISVAGSPVVIALAEHPVITYTDNSLHIKTADNVIDVPIGQISGLAFSETSKIMVADKQQIQMQEGYICFSQLPKDSKVTVLTLDGSEITSASVNVAGYATIDIGSLPSGVYLVQTAKQVIKITNKK